MIYTSWYERCGYGGFSKCRLLIVRTLNCLPEHVFYSHWWGMYVHDKRLKVGRHMPCPIYFSVVESSWVALGSIWVYANVCACVGVGAEQASTHHQESAWYQPVAMVTIWPMCCLEMHAPLCQLFRGQAGGDDYYGLHLPIILNIPRVQLDHQQS